MRSRLIRQDQPSKPNSFVRVYPSGHYIAKQVAEREGISIAHVVTNAIKGYYSTNQLVQ